MVQQTPSALRDLPGVNLSSVVRAGGTLPAASPELLEPLEAPSLLTRIWQGQPWAVTGAFALIFVATTALVALHHPAPQQQEPAPLPPPPAAPAPVARPSGPEMIVFSVSVTPSTAQIAIDGQVMPSNPFVGHFPKSGTAHRVRATAPGHSAKERLVTFDDNVMIDLSLTPAAQPPAPAPAAAHASNGGERSTSRRSEQSRPSARREPPPPPARPAAPVATPALAPPPAAAPSRSSNDIVPRGEWEPPRKRIIDTSNPYGEDK